MIQVLMGGTFDFINNNQYYFLDGGDASSTTRQFREVMIAEAGVLRNLQLILSAAPGAGTSVIATVLVNGVASALAITIANTATSGTDTDSVAVAAGDKVVLQFTRTGVPATASGRFACEFVATAANRAIWGSSNSTNIPSNVDARYGKIGASALDNFPNTTAAGAALPWNITATITSLYVELITAPGAGRSRAFTIYKNGSAQVSSTVTIADAATTGNVTGLSIAIVPTDLLALETLPSGTPANTQAQYGIAYAPTTDGQWNISGQLAADPTDGNFVTPNGISVSDATEANRLVLGDAATNASRNWRLVWAVMARTL